MQGGRYLIVRSNPATQFTDALAVGASGPMYDISAVFKSVQMARLKGIIATCVQGIGVQIDLWGNNAPVQQLVQQPSAAVLTDTWLGRATILQTAMLQVNAAGLFRGSVMGIDLPYIDLAYGEADLPPTIHAIFTVPAGGATAKLAAGAGAISVGFVFEPPGSTNW